jgi:hypothetical protein
MNLTINHLIRDMTKVDQADLLSCWQWKLKDEMRILMITNLGDLFLEGTDGYIYRLLTDGGEMIKIANSKSEFEDLLKEEKNIDNWLLPLLMEKLINADLTLKENEVYSPIKMAILGGNYDVSNFLPTDMSVHFAFTGQISEQVKDLPDGTPVNIKITK